MLNHTCEILEDSSDFFHDRYVGSARMTNATIDIVSNFVPSVCPMLNNRISEYFKRVTDTKIHVYEDEAPYLKNPRSRVGAWRTSQDPLKRERFMEF